MEPGRSLCRIGFPFHSISPVFDEATNTLNCPLDLFQYRSFPMKDYSQETFRLTFGPELPSIRTYRCASLKREPGPTKGQSGGPIFDADGYVWAIQSQTQHFPLGFSPSVPGGKPHEKEHQFLNVGWGIHVETLVATMRKIGYTSRSPPKTEVIHDQRDWKHSRFKQLNDFTSGGHPDAVVRVISAIAR